MVRNDFGLVLTPELAKIAGIHAGDGYLRYLKVKELDISGSFEEKGYYDNHVISLFNRNFGLSVTGKFFASRGTYGFVIRDRSVLNFFKQCGFPFGAKSKTVRVPQLIMAAKDANIIYKFLRGYFDTDG